MDIVSSSTVAAQDIKPPKKIRRTRSDWLLLIKAWECSSQTQQVFCQERALCYRQFSRWKSRFKNEDAEIAGSDSASFIPVNIHATPFGSSGNSIQVSLVNGIQVSLFNEAQVPIATALIKQLAALPC